MNKPIIIKKVKPAVVSTLFFFVGSLITDNLLFLILHVVSIFQQTLYSNFQIFSYRIQMETANYYLPSPPYSSTSSSDSRGGTFSKKKNTFQRVFLESRMNTPIPTTYSEENVNSLFHLMPDNTDQWMTSQKNFWQEGLFSFLTVLYVSQYFDNLKTNMGGEGRKLKIIYESNIS